MIKKMLFIIVRTSPATSSSFPSLFPSSSSSSSFLTGVGLVALDWRERERERERGVDYTCGTHCGYCAEW